MKIRLLIIVSLLACSGIIGADDYVDDVYAWESSRPEQTNRSNQGQTSQTNQTGQTKSTKPTITFIDDEVTRQNPDTVVRVVIHRN